jgi:hypothetical protein
MTHLSERCRSELYRLRIEAREDQFVFLMAENREHAARRARAAVSILHDVPLHEARIVTLDSFADLMCFGVSEDRDARVFEAAPARGKVAAWIRAPLFLTADATLLAKWAELNAGAFVQAAKPALWCAS